MTDDGIGIDDVVDAAKEEIGREQNFTCLRCIVDATCEMAYDPYNIDGECIMMK